MRRFAVLLLSSFLLAMAGCGPAVRFAPEDGVHVVQRGETLYSIATSYDLDWKEVARRNGIRSPYTLYVGQRLRITGQGASAAPVSSGPADESDAPTGPPVGSINWAWPTEGRVVSTFLNGHATRKGIDIAGTMGQPVRAAAAGEVVYSGSGLAGYGKLIILKHDARFLSAYAITKIYWLVRGNACSLERLLPTWGSRRLASPGCISRFVWMATRSTH